jgi:hypothetical protein
MTKSRAYALSGRMFALIAVGTVARNDILPGVLVFLLAVGCMLRAHNERKREQAWRPLSTHLRQSGGFRTQKS